jgi:hypothetical protein
MERLSFGRGSENGRRCSEMRLLLAVSVPSALRCSYRDCKRADVRGIVPDTSSTPTLKTIWLIAAVCDMSSCTLSKRKYRKEKEAIHPIYHPTDSTYIRQTNHRDGDEIDFQDLELKHACAGRLLAP